MPGILIGEYVKTLMNRNCCVLIQKKLSLQVLVWSTDYYKEVKVDLRSLIETIYVSPQSEDWFLDLVKTMRRKYNLCCDVKRSELNDSPYV